MKESVRGRLLYITTPDALWRNCQTRCEKPLAKQVEVPNHLPGERCLVLIEESHPGSPWPQYATLFLPHTERVDQIISYALLTNAQYNALLDNVRLSKRLVCSQCDTCDNSSAGSSWAMFVTSIDILFNLARTTRAWYFLLREKAGSALAMLVSTLSNAFTALSISVSKAFCASSYLTLVFYFSRQQRIQLDPQDWLVEY